MPKTPVMAQYRRLPDLQPAVIQTPSCVLCGTTHLSIGENALVILKGTWFNHREFDVPVFVLDPRTEFQLVQLPNGAYAFVFNDNDPKDPHVDSHVECFEQMAEEYLEEVYDDHDYNEVD